LYVKTSIIHHHNVIRHWTWLERREGHYCQGIGGKPFDYLVARTCINDESSGVPLQAVKRCERVYLEAYTSILMVPKERLVSLVLRESPFGLIQFPLKEEFYGKTVITATRETVELESDDILRDADKVDVAFLVVGDPLGYVNSSPRIRQGR
jgi:hypothetical protein